MNGWMDGSNNLAGSAISTIWSAANDPSPPTRRAVRENKDLAAGCHEGAERRPAEQRAWRVD